MDDNEDLSSLWPSTVAIYMPNGRPLKTGDLLVQNDLARTFSRLIAVEKGSASKGREAGIRAARDYFYKGDMAKEMVSFSEEQGGLLTLQDFADFSVKLESPELGRFREYEVFTCGPWCQGPVVAQTLQMLEDDDLGALGHNTPDYIHLVTQALNLAYSDRDHYYGDPDHVEVPMDGLLSKDYTRSRRTAVDMDRTYSETPPPGEPWQYQGKHGRDPATQPQLAGKPGRQERDTSYTCAVDRWGNAFSATPSDGIWGSPIVPGLGIPISDRGAQNWLDPDHPSSLQPWKRPRLTPNPAMAFKNGKLFMPFGTPGGDAQCSAMVQMFLNIAEFGMSPQRAIEEPRFIPLNFPNSFWPHTYYPGRLEMEGRINGDITVELARRGHDLRVLNEWSPTMGALSGIVVDPESGTLKAGADPRRDTYAMGR